MPQRRTRQLGASAPYATYWQQPLTLVNLAEDHPVPPANALTVWQGHSVETFDASGAAPRES